MKTLLPPIALLACLAFLPAPAAAAERLWNVKAITAEGATLDVKAFDRSGKGWDLKAIEEDGELHLMDVKALVDGKRLPVKILVSDDALAPVKAIAEGGVILDVKALTPEGQKLDVKGVSRSGNIVHVKAIGPGGVFYGVKALSPEGHLEDVKGVKLSADRVEAKVNGVEVAAHVKALPQIGDLSDGDYLWHVRAVQPDGRFLAVQAFDKAGKGWDLKVVEEAGNLHLMDVKAIVGGKRLPVKLVGAEPNLLLEAIGEDGTRYEVKALGPKGEKLEVKGMGRAGNVIGVKALGPGGAVYGVKAVSPRGQLHDVKGLSLSREKVEAKVNGVDVAAHVKALPQVTGAAK